jgi:hypothetical protein
MEYQVQLSAAPADVSRLEAMLEAEDPAAVSEVDGCALQWRVNTNLRPSDLVALLGRNGLPTPLSKVRALPSVCCGGCSG